MYSFHTFDTKTRNIVSQCFSIYCKTVFNCRKVMIQTSIQRVILVRSSLCPGMVLTATARISALNHRLSRPNYCLNTRDMLVSKLNCIIVAQYIHSHQCAINYEKSDRARVCVPFRWLYCARHFESPLLDVMCCVSRRELRTLNFLFIV